MLARFAASDLVLVDGTFWRDDELARLGISTRSARDMGHLPLSGPGGTLEALARLERPRKALVHINNTNPILLEDSPERAAVVRAGVEVAYDGLEECRSCRPPEEFIAELRAQGTRYHNLHPFHRRMDAGELTRDGAPALGHESLLLPEVHSAEGRGDHVELPRGRGPARVDPADHRPRRYSEGTGGIESWLRLGEALGVSREELESERGVLPGVRYAVDAYVNFARQKPWIEAVASSLTELFGPAAIRVRLEALERHYAWIDPAGLEYFRTRLVKAPRDARVRARARGRALPHARAAGRRGGGFEI